MSMIVYVHVVFHSALTRGLVTNGSEDQDALLDIQQTLDRLSGVVGAERAVPGAGRSPAKACAVAWNGCVAIQNCYLFIVDGRQCRQDLTGEWGKLARQRGQLWCHCGGKKSCT